MSGLPSGPVASIPRPPLPLPPHRLRWRSRSAPPAPPPAALSPTTLLLAYCPPDALGVQPRLWIVGRQRAVLKPDLEMSVRATAATCAAAHRYCGKSPCIWAFSRNTVHKYARAPMPPTATNPFSTATALPGWSNIRENRRRNHHVKRQSRVDGPGCVHLGLVARGAERRIWEARDRPSLG